MKSNLFPLLLLTVFSASGCNKNTAIKTFEVPGINDPVILLNGTWKFTMNPPENFWENNIGFKDWDDIEVPGECQMQGFPVKHDLAFVYKYKFLIPEDYKEKQIFLNFYGVYSYARIWVNGHYIREHFGGFTKWDCDITESVSAGDSAIVTIEVTDRTDDISFGSGYAKHQIGGILRDVELVALPDQHFKQLYYETDLDENYKNAELIIFYELASSTPASVKFELYDTENRLVESMNRELDSSAGKVVIPLINPQKWDAEHPNLYKLVTSLIKNGEEILIIPEKIGFREVTIKGNKLFVNGNLVKLRGACRHDIHPLLGRMTTPEYDKLDVQLAKEANMNFIRTSHYPPSETFLDYCDQYGIYVEDETAICFVNSARPEPYLSTGGSYNNPEFTSRYLSQLEEMVKNHRNHPSIIIWSIGNESSFGINFVASYNWVRENDSTRPVIFSYPGNVPENVILYEILSMHYPNWDGNLEQFGIKTRGFNFKEMPVLFDEWAHVACYNNYELLQDPNVRNFWGQSLDSMWTRLFESDGGLGGAIWGMIDETFMLPEDLPGFNELWGIVHNPPFPAAYKGPCVGYGEWGIVDTWRRKKPEFWATKKAYSPAKIYQKQLNDFEPDQELVISVHNRFDHTNFKELKINWKHGNQSGELKNIDIEPHTRGEIVIPPNRWDPQENLIISFYQNDTFLIDTYNLQLGKKEVELPVCKNGQLKVEETGDRFIISGKNITFNIDKRTGLLENVSMNETVLIKSGPYINLKLPEKRPRLITVFMEDYAENWKCTDFSINEINGIVTIKSKGVYDSISASFIIQIDEEGLFNIDYEIKEIPEGNYLQEVGLKFITGTSFDKLSWNRDSYFTAYPPSHPGKPAGEVDLNEKPEMNYREKPEHGWEMDTREFYYLGPDKEFPYSNIVRSLKENIYSYSLKTKNNSTIEVLSDGKQACRFDKINEKNTLIINEKWDYTNLSWGNYMKRIKTEKEFQGQVILKIN